MFELVDLVTGKRERTKRLAATLDDFLANAKNNSLTDEEARKNLEEGVIELVESGEHSSNGLLISDDGYFLTARHCVAGSLPLQIVLYDGMKCKVEKICAQGKIEWIDIALVKADVPGNAVFRNYRYHLETNKYIGGRLPVALFTRRNKKLVKKYGVAGSELFPLWKDSFASSIPIIGGDSGGIVANKNYELMGIMRGFFDLHTSFNLYFSKAFNLVDFYKRCLESRS